MKLNYLFGAVAACGLLAGAAYAQSTTSSMSDTTQGAQSSQAAPASGDVTAPSGTSATMSDQSTGASAASATSAGQNASANVTTVTNGPVPDTKENRARFGGPNSHAGRRTAAKGN